MLITPCLRLASILTLAFFSFSCTHPDDGMVRGRRAVNTLMDSVECVMDDYPAHADSMMQRIDSHSIRNRKLRARYALLYTATQYKCYQPFTSDSLIMEAVRYYSTSSNTDYRFLSYYYLGCVYIDIGQYTDAGAALGNAERISSFIDNKHWIGLLYSRLGWLFFEVCDYNRASEYYNKAEVCFKQAGRERHRLYAMLNLGRSKINMKEYGEADSILRIVEKKSIILEDKVLQKDCVFNRLSCFVYMNEYDSANTLYNINSSIIEESSRSFGYMEIMALYYNSVGEYAKSESYIEQVRKCALTDNDSIFLYYVSYLLAKNKGEEEMSWDYYNRYTSLQNEYLKKLLSQPILGAQYDRYREVTELESIKARNKITILVASVIVFVLIVLFVVFYSRNKSLEAERQIREYISTINELTTQISVNQDKIGSLNAKVREMIRKQFNSSDYLYTRYYEQMDDNKKAERVYRVVKSQLAGFTGPKNISQIDDLLNESFDGIMTKLSLSGLEIKEKDLLLLRFTLTGFSAKSIAALLDESHINISQRKKRMLDKIQLMAPNLMDELRKALNDK